MLRQHSVDVSDLQLQPQRPRISYRSHVAARLMRSFL